MAVGGPDAFATMETNTFTTFAVRKRGSFPWEQYRRAIGGNTGAMAFAAIVAGESVTLLESDAVAR